VTHVGSGAGDIVLCAAKQYNQGC